MSPAIWQQFVYKVFENAPNREIYNIMMDAAMVCSRNDQHIEDSSNLLRALIKFGLKISSHKCQYFRDNLM